MSILFTTLTYELIRFTSLSIYISICMSWRHTTALDSDFKYNISLIIPILNFTNEGHHRCFKLTFLSSWIFHLLRIYWNLNYYIFNSDVPSFFLCTKATQQKYIFFSSHIFFCCSLLFTTSLVINYITQNNCRAREIYT